MSAVFIANAASYVTLHCLQGVSRWFLSTLFGVDRTIHIKTVCAQYIQYRTSIISCTSWHKRLVIWIMCIKSFKMFWPRYKNILCIIFFLHVHTHTYIHTWVCVCVSWRDSICFIFVFLFLSPHTHTYTGLHTHTHKCSVTVYICTRSLCGAMLTGEWWRISHCLTGAAVFSALPHDRPCSATCPPFSNYISKLFLSSPPRITAKTLCGPCAEKSPNSYVEQKNS